MNQDLHILHDDIYDEAFKKNNKNLRHPLWTTTKKKRTSCIYKALKFISKEFSTALITFDDGKGSSAWLDNCNVEACALLLNIIR